MSDSEGLTSFGRYSIIRKLARGGMADVFLARAAGPMGFEKMLVLKRMLPELARDETFVQMFLSEAKVAAALQHPNVAQIFDFGEVNGQFFIAMEFVDGPNLRSVIRRCSEIGVELPPELCAKAISVACEGLHYVHEQCDSVSGRPLELVHRDVSPDNIMLARNGTLKVLDFGIMRSSNGASHTRSGAVRGKLAYMAPEQVSGEVLDRRTDVWALGMVLYELLTTGRRPFEATQDAAVMKAILFEPFKPVREWRPAVPEALQVIVERCFQKRRQERCSSARELQVELEQHLRAGQHEVGSYELAAMILALDQGRPPTVGPSTIPMPAKQLQAELNARAETVRARTPTRKEPETIVAPPPVAHAPPPPAAPAASQVTTVPGPLKPRSRVLPALLGGALVIGLGAGAVVLAWPRAAPARQPVVVALPAPEPEPTAAPVVDAPPPPAPLAEETAPAPAPEPRPLKRTKATPRVEAKAWPVELRALPDAEVTVDGAPTPLRKQVQLAAGAHRARFTNAELGAADVSFEVRPCLNIIGYNLTTRQLSQQCRAVGP